LSTVAKLQVGHKAFFRVMHSSAGALAEPPRGGAGRPDAPGGLPSPHQELQAWSDALDLPLPENVGEGFGKLFRPSNTSTDHSCASDTYYHLPQWMACVDDDETIDPVSDEAPDLTSSGSEDEQPSAGWPLSAHGPIKAPTTTVCGLNMQQAIHPPDDVVPSEETLVDLDPEEGRRRGDQLLSMLGIAPDRDADGRSRIGEPRAGDVDVARTNAFLAGLSTESPQGFQRLPPGYWAPPIVEDERSWQCGSGVVAPMGRTMAGVTLGHNRERVYQTEVWQPQASVQPDSGVSCCARATHATAVHEAACRAFGARLRGVVDGTDGAFVVRVCVDLAAEAVGEGALDDLDRALWPLLGREVIGLDRSPSDGGRPPRLLMWCLCGSHLQAGEFCWDFARRSACTRGRRCRWPHVVPCSLLTEIEVCFVTPWGDRWAPRPMDDA